MKRFLKSLLVAVAVIPLAFTLVACGGDQLSSKADVDTKGKYQEVSMEEAESYVNTTANKENGFEKGARVSFNVSVDTSNSALSSPALSAMLDSIPTKGSMEMNAIVRWTVLEDKITVNEMAYRSKANINNKEVSADCYIKSNIEYINAQSGATKIQYKKTVDMQEIFKDDTSLASIALVGGQYNVGEVLADIKRSYAGKSDCTIVLEKATSGKYTKLHFAVKQKTGETETVLLDNYFVYKSNSLVGFTGAMSMGGLKVEYSVETFDGTVKLPKGAEDYSTTIPSEAKMLEVFDKILSA